MIRPQQIGLLTRTGYRIDWNIDAISNTLRWVELECISPDTFYNVHVMLGTQEKVFSAGGVTTCMRFDVNLPLARNSEYSDLNNYIKVLDSSDPNRIHEHQTHSIGNEISSVYYIKDSYGNRWDASTRSFVSNCFAWTAFRSRGEAEFFLKQNNTTMGNLPFFIEMGYDFK